MALNLKSLEDDLDARIKRTSTMIEQTIVIIESVKTHEEALAHQEHLLDVKEQMATTEKGLEFYWRYEQKFRDQLEVLKKAKQFVASGDVGVDVKWDELLKKWTDEQSADRLEAVNKEVKANLLDFRRKIWAINHRDEIMPGEENEDIVVVGSQEDIKECPITGEPLTDPVKNRECGHTYSRKGIEHIIKSKAKENRKNSALQVKCPVTGCPKFVSHDTLENNVAVMLAQKRKQPSRSKETANNKRNKHVKKEKGGVENEETPDGVEDLTQQRD